MADDRNRPYELSLVDEAHPSVEDIADVYDQSPTYYPIQSLRDHLKFGKGLIRYRLHYELFKSLKNDKTTYTIKAYEKDLRDIYPDEWNEHYLRITNSYLCFCSDQGLKAFGIAYAEKLLTDYFDFTYEKRIDWYGAYQKEGILNPERIRDNAWINNNPNCSKIRYHLNKMVESERYFNKPFGHRIGKTYPVVSKWQKRLASGNNVYVERTFDEVRAHKFGISWSSHPLKGIGKGCRMLFGIPPFNQANKVVVARIKARDGIDIRHAIKFGEDGLTPIDDEGALEFVIEPRDDRKVEEVIEIIEVYDNFDAGEQGIYDLQKDERVGTLLDKLDDSELPPYEVKVAVKGLSRIFKEFDETIDEEDVDDDYNSWRYS